MHRRKSQSGLANELTSPENRVRCGALRRIAIRDRGPMATKMPVFTRETFQFFNDLGRHNRKEWMEANRDRYRATIVQPFRRLLEELAPTALELDSRFDTSGRAGANFSRINRD